MRSRLRQNVTIADECRPRAGVVLGSQPRNEGRRSERQRPAAGDDSYLQDGLALLRTTPIGIARGDAPPVEASGETTGGVPKPAGPAPDPPRLPDPDSDRTCRWI